MALKTDLAKSTQDIFAIRWEEREPNSILSADKVSLGGDAIKYDPATILYTDIDESTKLVADKSWAFVAEVFKSFLYCSSRLIRHFGGTITSYDGDRVMGIFIGGSQSRNAVRCALNINYAKYHIINPAIKSQYPSTDFALKTVTGVDVGTIRGVRGNNDLAWIGRAPNLAAKLTELSSTHGTWITNSVYNRLSNDEKKASDGRSMWEERTWTAMDNMPIYRSDFWWDTIRLD